MNNIMFDFQTLFGVPNGLTGSSEGQLLISWGFWYGKQHKQHQMNCEEDEER